MSAFEEIPDEVTLTKGQLKAIVNITIDACWDAVRWGEGIDSGVMWLHIKQFIDDFAIQ
jgi:hypothetical protein